MEVANVLQGRVKIILSSASAPPSQMLIDAGKQRKMAGNSGGPQNWPGADGGLNKKERLSKLVVEGGKGHSFEWGTTTGVNCTVKCKVCGLYIEQTAPLDKFRTLEAQLCAHVQCPWPAHWPKSTGSPDVHSRRSLDL